MLTDILTILRKEFKEIFLMRGSLRAGLGNVLILVGIIGILMPITNGPSWLDSPISALVWSWLPIFSSLGIVADAIAGERERHTLETLLASRLSDRAILFGKIGATVLYAWLLAIGSLVVGAVTVNVAFFDGAIHFYSPALFLGSMLMSFLVALLLAAVGVLVSLRAENARQAYQRLSIVMIVLWLLPVLAFQFLPAALIQPFLAGLSVVSLQQLLVGVTVALLVANALVIALAMARFQRSRLVID